MSSNDVTIPTPSLTSLLYVKSAKYSAATQHPFLTAAGDGSLANDQLSYWLAQDRIYASHAYPRFIGQLIAKIPFSSAHAASSPEQQRNDRILRVLSFCLQNIVREVAFFSDTSEKFGLEIGIRNQVGDAGWPERKATMDYTAEMARIAALGTLGEGLVFLWAMERVYLDAWKHVASARMGTASTEPLSSLSLATAVDGFVTNWTSAEFEAFVRDLADLVDLCDVPLEAASVVWNRVLELEEAFWPEEGEALAVKSQ
ncbi:heme oxygenase-like protein [Punctularia strigosozonata HHB-11173 SS5]|uniref:heme oxygenase-like protein n=1 Tax=Punctularia strigosozonata (strain HHB-11173) TaxID=741275 RepID=UPI0004416C4E|nr:heme oxygenase-like protein [Punctularia strigosozonata HHB-11173 SS5]EIN08334.1 heme oxygenase-like protein [Punctularia strigosozonata HHB-11173 SS5]